MKKFSQFPENILLTALATERLFFAVIINLIAVFRLVTTILVA